MDDRSPNHVTTKALVLRIVVVAAIVVVASLIVNRVVTANLGPGAERHAAWFVGDDIGLEYVRNTGAAFGMFQGNAELLAVVSIVVSIAIVALMLSEMESAFWATVAAGFTLGGAIGNLIGRLVDGYVTDYVAVGPWPRFNIADSAITIGIAVFVVSLVFERSSFPAEVDGADDDARENGFDGGRERAR